MILYNFGRRTKEGKEGWGDKRQWGLLLAPLIAQGSLAASTAHREGVGRLRWGLGLGQNVCELPR